MHIDTVIDNIKHKNEDYIQELLRDDETMNRVFAKDPATGRQLFDMAMHRMRPIDAQRMRAFAMTHQRQFLPEISKRANLAPIGKPMFPPPSMYKPFVPASSSRVVAQVSPVVAQVSPASKQITPKEVAKPKKLRAKRGAPCGEGRERNPKTNRCRKSRPKKPCKEGQVRNPKTGRCKKMRDA